MAPSPMPQESRTLANIVEGTEAFALLDIAARHGGAAVFVAPDDARLERVADSIAFFAPHVSVLRLPAWDCIPYDRVSPNSSITGRRLRTLHALAGANHESRIANREKPPTILLTTVNAAIQRVIPRAALLASSLTLKPGDRIARDGLARILSASGYFQAGTANDPGEYALRGSIVDIVPAGEARGCRLDFFGDRLESIRFFDPLTQISSSVLERLDIIPASETLLNDEAVARFRQRYRELFGVARNDPLYDAVSEKRHYAGMEHWLPLFHDRLETVFDYAPDAPVALCHLAAEALRERAALIRDSYETRRLHAEKPLALVSRPRGGSHESRGRKDTSLMNECHVYPGNDESHFRDMTLEASYQPIPPEMLYLSEAEWAAELARRQVFQFHPFALPEAENVTVLPYRKGRDYAAESGGKSAIAAMAEDSRNSPKPMIIACMSEGSAARLEQMLEDTPLTPARAANWPEAEGAKTAIAILRAESGYETDRLRLVTEQDLFGERIFRRRKTRDRAPEAFLAEAASFGEGEWLVHKEHGIGRFEKLETITAAGQAHDCLKLIYRDGDRLFVPVENIDLVSRYGGESEGVVPDKLGGLGWQQRRAEAKRRIRMLAGELMKIAAARALETAPVFIPEPHGYDAFCARFPYPETEDQERAIAEALADLASGRPMDRLVCGDVGFGKTEVALRAAFAVACGEMHGAASAASKPRPALSATTSEGEEEPSHVSDSMSRSGDNYQIAVVVPTTLLCRQHYATFSKRFAGTGVAVCQMSRLTSAAGNKKTKEMLKSGEAGIVIGTHALLSDGVSFKNLALLIVDEEQHFGVKQKEKLKALRASTHVLTLTATPIPRTLQLSMSGVRELSLIATPPVDRLAVRTFVMPYDPVVIREAILRERFRGGRSFYVCPRIADLDGAEERLRALVPEVKIATAHGQMASGKLDEIMTAFDDGAFDVLLCTTIVESGLDIPAANTLVVHRAEMFGLSQLYQIRGRVGRAKQRAYAYLTLPPGKTPTKQAVKRLEVMQKLDHLGAGFSLASHDMDIRGFGNLLGEEQSGNIREVGLELYQEMLREAVAALKSERREAEREQFSPKINLGLPVLIPESYVADVDARMGLYRRIGDLADEAAVDSMAAELADRFGPVPQEVKNLLDVVGLKILCRKAGVERLDAGAHVLSLSFHPPAVGNPQALLDYVFKRPATMKLRGENKLTITGAAFSGPSLFRPIRAELEVIAAVTNAAP